MGAAGVDIIMEFNGVKIAVLIDGNLLMHLRDNKPGLFQANMWDFPGGGREGNETPQECAIREIKEEFDITLDPRLIVWEKVFPAMKDPTQNAFFMVAKVPKEVLDTVTLSEGQKWTTFDIETFFAKDDVVDALKGRFRDYMERQE